MKCPRCSKHNRRGFVVKSRGNDGEFTECVLCGEIIEDRAVQKKEKWKRWEREKTDIIHYNTLRKYA